MKISATGVAVLVTVNTIKQGSYNNKSYNDKTGTARERMVTAKYGHNK